MAHDPGRAELISFGTFVPTMQHHTWTNTVDTGSMAGAIAVSPEELIEFRTRLEATAESLQRTIAYNQHKMDRRELFFELGPTITGVSDAIDRASMTTEKLMQTLAVFDETLQRDIAAVEAAHQSYVATDADGAAGMGGAGAAV